METINFNKTKVTKQLWKRYVTKENLKDETKKRMEIESEVNTLEKRVKSQAKEP